MRIGIVGAENSHCLAVAKTLNVDKVCGSARVVAVWGETRAFAKKAAKEGKIPEIVRKPGDMIGRIDGVMIDHRHAKFHIPVAEIFVKAGIPTFVDKPFSYTVSEGVKLLALAKKRGVSVSSFSVIPEQKAFKTALRKQIKNAGKITFIETTGPCDIKSRYGGIFFYGIHQVDAILKAFGPGIEKALVIKAGRRHPNAVAVLNYENGGPVVSMNLVAEGKCGFTFRAFGTKGMVHYENLFDPNPYLSGIRTFLKMFRTGKEPFTLREILEPIAVLEALDRSCKTGKQVRVKKIPGL